MALSSCARRSSVPSLSAGPIPPTSETFRRVATLGQTHGYSPLEADPASGTLRLHANSATGASEGLSLNCQTPGVPVSCDTWALAFVPFVGPLLAGVLNFNTGWRLGGATLAVAVGIPLAATQAAGFIVLLVGLVADTEAILSADLGSGLRLAFEPGAAGADGGVSMRLEF